MFLRSLTDGIIGFSKKIKLTILQKTKLRQCRVVNERPQRRIIIQLMFISSFDFILGTTVVIVGSSLAEMYKGNR